VRVVAQEQTVPALTKTLGPWVGSREREFVINTVQVAMGNFEHERTPSVAALPEIEEDVIVTVPDQTKTPPPYKHKRETYEIPSRRWGFLNMSAHIVSLVGIHLGVDD